jgi:hypothetical protein
VKYIVFLRLFFRVGRWSETRVYAVWWTLTWLRRKGSRCSTTVFITTRLPTAFVHDVAVRSNRLLPSGLRPTDQHAGHVPASTIQQTVISRNATTTLLYHGSPRDQWNHGAYAATVARQHFKEYETYFTSIQFKVIQKHFFFKKKNTNTSSSKNRVDLRNDCTIFPMICACFSTYIFSPHCSQSLKVCVLYRVCRRRYIRGGSS